MSNKKLFGWLDFASSIGGVAANVLSTLLTNRKNEQLARQQNAFQRQENELAYQRAKPQNQVSQMMQAGMSKAGALNAINGGATYQPAPISSATAQAPQIDLTSAFDGLLQIGENAKQRKMQEDMLQKNIDAAVAAQQKQFEENERQRKHDLEIQSREHTNTNRNADNRLNFEKEQFDKLSPYQIREIEASIDKIKADTNLTKKQQEDLAYRLAEYKSVEYKSVRDAKNLLEGLQADFDYKITNKSFSEYLNENYDYNEKTGEYTLKNWQSNANKVQQGARVIWNTIFELIPVNVLLEALGGTVENVRAIKLLSKVK